MGPEAAGLGIPPELLGWVALAALPLILAAATCFTKVSVVLAALRIGLSAETLLPYGAMFALALVVTTIVMGPVGFEVAAAIEAGGGIETLLSAPGTAWLPVFEPLQAFLLAHAEPSELEFFAELQGTSSTHPLALVPAFLVTELTEALHIAVLIILPFVVVDLLVSQTLTLLGLQQQPLPIVTIPLKVMLFLAAGGWDIVLGALVEGYA
jgi:type III secretory pathway component EscR